MNICDDCGSLNATVRLTHVESNEAHTFHLCEDCARDRGVPLPDGSDAFLKGLEAIISGAAAAALADTQVKVSVKPPAAGVIGQHLAAAAAGAAPVPDTVCSGCRMKLSEFRTGGWLGCAACYGAFDEQISKTVVQIHGAGIHKGKRYGESAVKGGGKKELERLRRELDEAISGEQFEQAASIRDAIRSLQGVK